MSGLKFDLWKGDCLELMKDIPDGSVDLILTDPPYGTTACKWDSVIPFDLMWEQLKRIIKPSGAIVLFGSEPFSSMLRCSNLKMFKYDWVWEKSKVGNVFNCKNAPQKNFENIMIFSNGTIANGSSKKMPYFPQGLIDVNILKKNQRKGCDVGTITNRPSRKNGSEYTQTKTNYPRQIIKFNNEQGFHPTQKPVALLEYLIKTYTQEGETVLDFTAGSFSTAIACLNTNRNFIGIELDDGYFDIGVKRIKEHIESNNMNVNLDVKD